MKQLFLKQRSTIDQSDMANVNSYEKLKCLTDLADLSIQLEETFKTKPTSYLRQQEIKTESAKYRPSKQAQQSALKRYFEDELGENAKHAVNAAVIASISPDSKLSIKFLAFDSILHHTEILNVLSKIGENNLHPALIVYNSYRQVYLLYLSRGSIDAEENREVKEYFEMAQSKMLEKTKKSQGEGLIASGRNFRVIKCSSNVNKHGGSYSSGIGKSYFNF